MWINTDAILESIIGAAIAFIIHTAMLLAVCGILDLFWRLCKRIYKKIKGMK